MMSKRIKNTLKTAVVVAVLVLPTGCAAATGGTGIGTGGATCVGPVCVTV